MNRISQVGQTTPVEYNFTVDRSWSKDVGTLVVSGITFKPIGAGTSSRVYCSGDIIIKLYKDSYTYEDEVKALNALNIAGARGVVKLVRNAELEKIAVNHFPSSFILMKNHGITVSKYIEMDAMSSADWHHFFRTMVLFLADMIKHGYVHNDINEHNILVMNSFGCAGVDMDDDDNLPKARTRTDITFTVIDFHLANKVCDRISFFETLTGPRYPPEYRSKHIISTHEGDIYMFGNMLTHYSQYPSMPLEIADYGQQMTQRDERARRMAFDRLVSKFDKS